jgi:predicted ATP-grasp superfamily ATP-dependent carboligase
LEHKDEDCNITVSRYLDDIIPLNAHFAIFKKEIIVFPGSVQIVEVENNCLLYKGGDYIAFKTLSEKNRKYFYDMTYSLASMLQEMGFRGICGIDVLVGRNDELYLMEVNPRFQGSSNILNRALVDQGCDSLFKINIDSFVYEDAKNINIGSNFSVDYSSYSLINNSFGKKAKLHDIVRESGCVDYETDGLDDLQHVDENIYLYKLIFDTSYLNHPLDIQSL